MADIDTQDSVVNLPSNSTLESEARAKLLFQHFCNNLYLGQWQLARTCVNQLHVQSKEKSVLGVLKDVANHPFHRSVQSASVTSPCQLAWLALLEYDKLAGDGAQVQTDSTGPDKDLIEFHLLLLEVCPFITDGNLKELYLYYKWIHSQGSSSGVSLTISPSLLKFLQTLLSRHPYLGHTLISTLYSSQNSHLVKNNRALQLVYINSINSLLDNLTAPEHNHENKLDTAERVYQIFSHFDADGDVNHLPLRQVFSKILEQSRHEPCYISKTKTASVLIGQSQNYLLTEFCRLDYELETNNAVATYQACAELTEEQRWLLHLSTLSDINARWKMFFLLSKKKKKHLLEVIMETGLCLIKCSMFDELQRLVEPEELHPLKPLLLLLGWTQCYSSAEARRLLQTLWGPRSVCQHPAITVGCNKLAYQIDLIQWCLDRARPLAVEESSPGPQFQRAADLFKGLESHSVLYVLHNATRLSALDQEEVLNLLQKVPLQGATEDGSEIKKPKTVRFQEESNELPLTQITSLDQQKDMTIYTGYCVLKNLMDAILFCWESSDDRISNPIRPHSRHKVSNKFSSANSSDSDGKFKPRSSVSSFERTNADESGADSGQGNGGVNKKNAQNHYKENVTKKLAQAKLYLSKMQPLTFRLEILEDVFSLLFLTHEDVQETLLLSEYNSDDADDKSCRSNSTSLETPSLSPIKDSSMEPKFSDAPPPDADVTEVGGDYDTPFLELPKPTAKRNLSPEIDMEKVGEKLEIVRSKVSEAHAENRLSSVSEYISSMSAGSSGNLSRFGFIANEYLVRDILALLKDCIVDISAAKYQIHGGKGDVRERYRSSRDSKELSSSDVDPSVEEALCRLVKSSVTMDTLHKRLTQLERYTSEAHWRYQLVVNDHVPKSPGEILSEVVVDAGGSSDEEVEIRGLGSGQPGRKRRRSGMRSSSQEVESSRDAQSDGNMSRRKRHGSRQMSVVQTVKDQARSQSLVAMMLSSPVTLLTMSIRKDQFTQTKQIIKLFKLEERKEAFEVYFFQAFQKASRSVQGIAGHSKSGTVPGKPSMKSLANVAAAGVATATVSNVVDELLSFPTMPHMPSLMQNENIPQNVAWNFRAENLPVVILLDLLTSGAKSWEVCNHLLDAIKSQQSTRDSTSAELPSTSADAKTSTGAKNRVGKIRTLSDMVLQVQSLLQLGADDQFPRQEQTAMVKSFQKSLQHYFNQCVNPLTADGCKELATLYRNMTKYSDRVQKAFQHHKQTAMEKSDEFVQSEMQHSPGSGKSPLKKKRVGSTKSDKLVIHDCMKKLILVLEKEVPHGGLVAMVTRQKPASSTPNRNYLLSLYEHCRELAHLVAESESQSRETMMVPRNYYQMLEEGPLRILGRMMFTKKMPPARLEKVAEKLSLNLTHIIVYSCCTRIPSKRLAILPARAHTQAETLEGGRLLYNCQSHVADGVDPEPFLRALLTRLVNLMKDFASRCHAENLFDITCADLMSNTAEFCDIIAQTALLQSVDLLHMDKETKKCFYGNLQTIMTIHCFMNNVKNVKAGICPDNATVKTSPSLRLYHEMSATEQILTLCTFCYRVGDLGVISLFDLKYHINRSGLVAPSEWGQTLKHRLQPLDPSDPWFALAPNPDPRLLFAMTTCCVSSPPIQVLSPSTVKEQLLSCIKTYLQRCVQVDKKLKQIKVPEVLLWHRQDFSSQQDKLEFRADQGLIAFIASHLSEEKERDIQELLSLEKASREKKGSQSQADLPFDIDVVPSCKEFMCVFNFESIPCAENHHRDSNRSSSSKNKSGEISSTSSEITYNLTPNTLEYIKSDCPLVATLISLVCSDEFEEVLIDDAFDESHFNASLSSRDSGNDTLNRSRAASSMSLVDMRSYRYEKLTYEYPALKRHLLNYIVPLAATEDHDILKGDDPILKLLTSEMMERFKMNMLSLHESEEFRAMLTGLLNDLFSFRKWAEILKVIDSVPVPVLKQDTSLQNLHDFVVCCLVHKLCTLGDETLTLSKKRSEEVTCLLHRMMCGDTQARQVLAVHHRLQIEHNMDLFEMCLCNNRLSNGMKRVVDQKFKQIKIYYRITECAKNLQFKLSLQTSSLITEEDKAAAKKRHLILDKFTDWRTVVEWTHTTPREVLALLVKTGDFDMAKAWGQIEDLDEQIKMEIEEYHVISLLNVQPPNTTAAFMILEQLKAEDVGVCLEMCRKFVGVFNKQQDVMFIASYMLDQLSQHLDSKEKDSLRLTRVGARMILCLPETMHAEYSHLVSMPKFILEQLLMNMKPELAGKAYTAVQEEYSLVEDRASRYTTEQFNTLVALYAKKALEFTVIQYLESGDRERSLSVRSRSSDMLDERDSPSLRHSPRHLDASQRKSVDLTGSSRLAVSAPSAGGAQIRRRAGSMDPNKFVMPAEPPPRDQWVADSATSVCMVCKVERFSMFNRRHHCRRCGRVVCASCSEKVTPIKGINARTCDDCYNEIVKSSTDRRSSTDDLYHQHQQRMSGSSLTPTWHTMRTESTILEERTLTLSEVVSHTHTVWKLQTNEEYNANLREDFYYEQAPSTSLCISVLDLHGNPRECGRLILGMCDGLSKFLKPLAPGVPNPEVDYSLIMSMMRYLLFHAKIKFTHCGDHMGMGRCDTYQGLVDLLGLLVVDNYRDLLSIEDLSKVDSVRRLRDKLIEDERLQLAMEVSTKCGLDPTGVWVASGMTCLRSGDFASAREKFAKCLKPLKDRNMNAPNTKVLNDIVDSLETMPGTGAMEIQVLLSNPASLKNLIMTPSSTFFEEASMDSQQFQECVYYLRTYGSYLSLVDFHRRHGYYMKAVQYILDHHCSTEVFVEGLVRPSLETGELGRLTDQMLMIDPSLERWNPYLTSACRFFIKHKLHHTLYDFQLFMKDFIRAGMTCYTYFYQHGAQSYLDLSRRIQYLFTAQQHMQAYLEPTQWGNVQHPLVERQGGNRGETGAVRLMKTADEVKSFIRTIALQIEVTKFLQTCLTSKTGESTMVAVTFVDSTKLPTLFGSSQLRNSLAIMILLSGNDVENSFALAHRIIREYKLGGVGIYTHAAREMTKHHRYDGMRQLLQYVEKSTAANERDEVVDEILGACLLAVADEPKEAKEAENIIKLLRKDANKINAFILCNKLRSAYLMAVKENRVDDVRRILRAANSVGQAQVVNICKKWLEQNNHA